VQLADNGAFTEMRESFIQEMRTLGYDEAQMIFDIKNSTGRSVRAQHHKPGT
ncbi:hypothetical protein OBE_15859, partial [human gut metagenome]